MIKMTTTKTNGPIDSATDSESLGQIALSSDREQAQAKVRALTEHAIRRSGRGITLSAQSFAGCDFSGFDLRYSSFDNAQLHAVNLSDADLTGSTLVCPSMEKATLIRARLISAHLHAIAAQVCDFRDSNLTNVVDATGSLFHGCNMQGMIAAGANFAGATFYQCNLDGASFQHANLQGTTFNECSMCATDLSNAKVSQANILRCYIERLCLRRADGQALAIQLPVGADGLCLEQAQLPLLRLVQCSSACLSATAVHAPEADVAACAFSYANCEEASFVNSRWVNCFAPAIVLRRANLDRATFLGCTANGSDLSEASAEDSRFVGTSLVGSNLAGLLGRGAAFRNVDLTSACLSDAYLYRAVLSGDPFRNMSLRKAKLNNANLVQSYVTADFTGADLRNANCSYARICQTYFRDATLLGLNFNQAMLLKCDLTGARVELSAHPAHASRCKGLEDV